MQQPEKHHPKVDIERENMFRIKEKLTTNTPELDYSSSRAFLHVDLDRVVVALQLEVKPSLKEPHQEEPRRHLANPWRQEPSRLQGYLDRD